MLGAVLATPVVLEVTNGYVLWFLLLGAALSLFSTRGMNLALSQACFTPFIIILLNILYPGQAQLDFFRVVEVSLGSVISVAAVYLVEPRSPFRRPR